MLIVELCQDSYNLTWCLNILVRHLRGEYPFTKVHADDRVLQKDLMQARTDNNGVCMRLR